MFTLALHLPFLQLHCLIFLELKTLNVRLQLLCLLRLFLSDSPIYDAPYLFNKRWMWTAGRPNKHTHSVSMKPCCCKACKTGLPLSLWKYHWSPGERRHLGGNICLSNIPMYTSASMIPSHMWNHPCPKHWFTPISSHACFCSFLW